MAIFPDDRPAPERDCEVVRIRLSKLEKAFLTKPWEQVREQV